jgi:hypothetical protein
MTVGFVPAPEGWLGILDCEGGDPEHVDSIYDVRTRNELISC